jgi:hypothetical protein
MVHSSTTPTPPEPRHGRASASPRLRAAALAFALLGTAQLAQAASLYEGFDSLSTAIAAGWSLKNNSVAPKDGWFPGETGGPFAAAAGAPSSYLYATWRSIDPKMLVGGTISNWLISPTLTFNNGDVLSFATRTETGNQFAERLEVRFSPVGGNDVGNTPDSVGTFTTLQGTLNPGLDATVYPQSWTTYATTISGLTGPTLGAIAFRYFVTDGGLGGNNSNMIAIDEVRITEVSTPAVPEPATWLLLAAGGATLWAARQRRSRGTAA